MWWLRNGECLSCKSTILNEKNKSILNELILLKCLWQCCGTLYKHISVSPSAACGTATPGSLYKTFISVICTSLWIDATAEWENAGKRDLVWGQVTEQWQGRGISGAQAKRRIVTRTSAVGQWWRDWVRKTTLKDNDAHFAQNTNTANRTSRDDTHKLVFCSKKKIQCY